jgi:protein-tyrosine phosphatase
MNRILFVCMGNICRSPVVEAVARAEFARAGLKVVVASAGIESYHIGHAADRRAIDSAHAHGYDVSTHRAQQVDAAMLDAFDAVLAMDNLNMRELGAIARSEQASRLALFLPFAGVDAPREVPDPYYGGARDFERVIELAKAGVDGLIRRCALAHNAGVPTGTPR